MKWQDIPDWSFLVAKAVLSTARLKDPYTYDHCLRVGTQARKLARAMGLNGYEQRLCEFVGTFHDVGKVGIPAQILNKPGRLDEDEFTLMKSHADMSVQVLVPLAQDRFFRDMVPGVRYHHERYDGRGYPHGLAADDIPLEARLVAVVDTVDAMMYARPYRAGLPFERVQQELIDFSGTQFDPAIVKIYLEAVRFFGQAEEPTQEKDNVVAYLQRKSA